jgi:hypothetical protein
VPFVGQEKGIEKGHLFFSVRHQMIQGDVTSG